MVVNVPLYTDLLNTTQTPESLQTFFADYYANEPFVKVMPLGAESEMSGFLSGNHLSGYDGMQIYITGNENLFSCLVSSIILVRVLQVQLFSALTL